MSTFHQPKHRPQPRNVGQERPIVRHYLVTLIPMGDVADRLTDEQLPSIAHEPIEVTLSYTEERAAAIDPRSDLARAEAYNRAVKVERNTHNLPADREFGCGEVRFTRQRLSTTTTHAPRPQVAA